MLKVVVIILLQIWNSNAEDECILKTSLYANETTRLTEPEHGTVVNVSFGNLQILKVDHFDCTITLNFHLKLRWKEPRLTYPCNDKEYIILRKSDFSWLWVSNVFIVGVKSYKTYTLNNLIHDFYIHFDEIDNVTIVGHETFLEVVFYCPMNFNKYPLDEHNCYLKMRDYNYHSEIVSYKLNEKDFIFNEFQKVSILDYAIDVNHGLPEEQIYDPIAGRNFKNTVIGFEINLKRYTKHYILDYYIPSALLVMLSWVSLKIFRIYMSL